MAETKKAFILTPKTLLGGIAGAALVASLALAPLSFAYADGSNDSGSNTSVSEDGEAANPAREAAETSMNNLGLDMEKTASEMADTVRKAGDGADHDGENNAKNSSSEHADQAGDHADQAGDHADQAGDHADQAGDYTDQTGEHADNQESVDKNAAPLMLADFLSSLRGGNQVVSSEGASSNLELRYGNGWKEEIDHGRYVLVDPNGNKIVNRLVTDADISRMRSALK